MWKFPWRLATVCQVLPVRCLTLSRFFNFPRVKNLKESSLLVLLKLSLYPFYKWEIAFFFFFFFHFCSRLLAGLPPPLVHVTDMPLVVLKAQYLHLKPTLSMGIARLLWLRNQSHSARAAFLLLPSPYSSVPVLGGPGLGPQEGRMLTLIAFLFSSGVFVSAD